ncbi:MAG: mandelate racemase/muconate lactonizing enzyme family protein [Thermoleophilia bacterium]|nr:mandelate racemase/muconate lactonizing enzyme family protein [Thermoleophilia bacterium]MDH5334504.1 mandelate racemase/muconate lactonizing enzyme family protein [Thermoleophilia bacterium]
MLIADVSVETFRIPLDPPIENGRYRYASVDLALVRVTTDDGIEGFGIGDGGVGLAGAPLMTDGTVASLRPALLDRDPLRTEQIWEDLWVPKLIGRRGFTTRVISAVDLALWDLKGRILGTSVARLLGQCHDRLPVYAAGGYYAPGKDVSDLVAEMVAHVERGIGAVKLKVGAASIAEDVRRVSAVRDAIGEDVLLLVDANNAYRRHEAVDLARRLEPLGVYWLEEPLMPDDYEGHAWVGQRSSIPIALGENEYTRYGFRDVIQHGAASILNPDAQFVGGATEFMKVGALAQAHDLPIAPHGSVDLHVHLAAALPNALILEYSASGGDRLWDAFFPERLPIRNGSVEPPQRPGFGIEPDEEYLATVRV